MDDTSYCVVSIILDIISLDAFTINSGKDMKILDYHTLINR